MSSAGHITCVLYASRIRNSSFMRASRRTRFLPISLSRVISSQAFLPHELTGSIYSLWYFYHARPSLSKFARRGITGCLIYLCLLLPYKVILQQITCCGITRFTVCFTSVFIPQGYLTTNNMSRDKPSSITCMLLTSSSYFSD